MKTKNLLFIFLVFLALPIVNAQNGLSMEEFMRKREYYPKTLPQLDWQGTSDRFAYTWGHFILSAKPGMENPDTILALPAINKALTASGIDSLCMLPMINWLDGKSFYFSKGNTVLMFNMETAQISKLVEFPEEAENKDVFGNGAQWAYTIADNLYIVKDTKHTALSNEENKGIVYGKTVHRSEFGIEKGTFWSPSGRYLAFYRMDESMVAEYPLVDIDDPIATPKPIRYPMAGSTSHQVTVGIYDLNSGKTIYLKTGNPDDHYLTNISWSPDEKSIFIAELNREQNHMNLNSYAVADGSYQNTLFEETSDRYVEPQNGLFFLPGNPNKFLWLSNRNAYLHLYLYDMKSGFEKQLTHGPWVVTDFLGFSADSKKVYFMATKESPLERHLYEVGINDGKIVKLTPDKGYNRVMLNNKKDHFIVTGSSNEVSGYTRVVDIKGKTKNTLVAPHNVFEGMDMPKVELLSIKSKDGVDLYCRLITPPNMENGKKYPVMVYVYGGPHAQMVTDSWLGGSNLFFTYMALKGYVIFTLDNRGSANRGREFEQAIHRRLGSVEVTDQLVGVDYLKKLDYVDTNRMGVYGWSYGGFMATTLMLDAPEVFKVGVAGGPVMDWKYYEVMYGERYMGTPQNNPDGYKNASLLNKAAKLKGRLLLIHGDNDDTVVLQHNLAFIKKCIQAGTMPDLMIYPGHGHNVGGRDRIHLYRVIERYFDDFL